MLYQLATRPDGRGRATVICSGGRGYGGANPTLRDFFLSPAGVQFLSRANTRKVSLGIIIQHFNLPHIFKALYMHAKPLILVTSSLTCSFDANCHLNYPRPTHSRLPSGMAWPCSSVSRATVRSWVRFLTRGQRFIQHFNLLLCELSD